MTKETTKKRGADPHVPEKPEADSAEERKLEQGLEESMAGSDPPSISQPSRSAVDKRELDKDK